MEIRFIGTGAADWDWSNRTAETRGPTSTLVNGRILFDFGTSSMESLEKNGVDKNCITDIFITHSHPDHFSPAEISKLATDCPLRLWGTARLLEDYPESERVSKCAIAAEETVEIGELTITAMPGNHFVRKDDTTLHYLLCEGGISLLYALDGAWLMAQEKSIIERMLQGRPLSAIIWDATGGDKSPDYRSFDHNYLSMIDDMRKAFAITGLVDEKTQHYFDHISRKDWPYSLEERVAVAARHGAFMAEDCGTFTL